MNESDLAGIFRKESGELLGELEGLLLPLESNPDDRDGVARIFRVMHTFKGSGGMAGFGEIVHFNRIFDQACGLESGMKSLSGYVQTTTGQVGHWPPSTRTTCWLIT